MMVCILVKYDMMREGGVVPPGEGVKSGASDIPPLPLECSSPIGRDFEISGRY
jgi:hypothetical protein